MSLYTETEINREIWENREYITGHKYPSDLAHEYADSAMPIYNSDTYLTWRDLPDENSNQYKEVRSELPDTIEELMRDDIYLYYCLLYSAAIYQLTEHDQILVNDLWIDKTEE